jgi:hypothetical protein
MAVWPCTGYLCNPLGQRLKPVEFQHIYILPAAGLEMAENDHVSSL